MGESDRFSIRTATPIDADGILNCLHLAFHEFRTSYTTKAFRDTVLTPETVRERLGTIAYSSQWMEPVKWLAQSRARSWARMKAIFEGWPYFLAGEAPASPCNC